MTRKAAFHICFNDAPPQPAETDCPNNAAHEPWPRGFLSSMAYAEKMLKTHDQSQCPACGKWAIWTPKQSQETEEN